MEEKNEEEVKKITVITKPEDFVLPFLRKE